MKRKPLTKQSLWNKQTIKKYIPILHTATKELQKIPLLSSFGDWYLNHKGDRLLLVMVEPIYTVL